MPTLAAITPRVQTRVAFRVVLLAVLIQLAPNVFAQYSRYRFEHWTTDRGLPQNTVRNIIQARDGYLWMTTYDGLVRFDGVRFTVFDKSNTPAIRHNRFTSVYEDRDGTLWAGTDLGDVISYRDGVFTSHTPGVVPANFPIMEFRRDLNGELMIANGTGTFYFRDGNFVAPREYNDPQVRLYRGTSGRKWRIDTHGVTEIDVQKSSYAIKLERLEAVSIYEDSRGELWLGYGESVYRLRDGHTTEYAAIEGLPPRMMMRPESDDGDGGVWFIASTALLGDIGVVRFKDERFTFYGSDAGLPTTVYTHIARDREGSIWVATSVGPYQMRKELITAYSTANGLSNNEVYPLLQTRDGRIVIGSYGLNILKDGQFEHPPLNPNVIVPHSLWEDRARRLWIGSAGLYRYQSGKLETVMPAEVGLWPVWAIREDRAGALWVGTAAGLVKLEKDKVVAHYTTKDGLPNDDVKVIHESIDETGQSVLWIGTWGGLARFRNGEFTAYTQAQGLTGDHVRSIYEDSDGVFWIGTYDDGLSRFHNGRFFNFRRDHGLYNNGVFQILEDRRGYFWISCNKGIYRVSRHELNEMAAGRISRVNSVAFGREDGMLSSECNGGRQPAGFVAQDGRLWFPTMGGAVVLDPEAARANPLPPPVIVESVTLERSRVDFSKGVTIEPGQRDLEIVYTGLSFIKPEQINFKYKLEGADDDWVDAGTRRAAYFSHLPPGRYRFRVIAANSDGVWNEQGAAIDIYVATPFYRAWWFVSLVAMIMIGAVALVYNRRIATLRARQAAQEAFSRQVIESQEQERKRIAAELHDSLGQNLLIVKNWALVGLNTLEANNPARQHLTEISETTSLAIDEVREIAHDLRPYQLERLGLTNTLEYMMRNIQNSSDIEFTVELENVDGLLSPESEISLYRMAQELINNVIKHSDATEVRLSVKHTMSGVQIVCRDNGKGFDPVVAVKSSNSGMGLSGLAERVRILGGRYMIDSLPGAGATITITVNVKKQ
jgi:signal transduction histidine kinase/ligand-binding sensor domain-containing protein